MFVKSILAERVEAAFATLGLEGPALVQAATRPEFGDYQANGVMAAAKRKQANPRDVANDVVAALDLSGIASNVEIAGPGFLNITIAPEFAALAAAGTVAQVNTPQTIVVDYSAPNLAKEMHVGHLRSTIIGDAVARVLEAQGHNVLRQNHVGDWGTQFGMLLAYMEETGANSNELADLEEFYRSSKQRFDADEDFQTRARERVVALQAEDPEVLSQWQKFIDISMSHCQEIYDRLGVTLKHEHLHGESSYNDALPHVIKELEAQGLLVESDGAKCVFLDEFKTKKGDPLPVIVQKSDGGYLYATTDLAAMEYRTQQLGVNRVLYFVDVRQSLHFKQIFTLGNLAGFNHTEASFEHMPFGTMLGADGKPFKTRSGDIVKLADLLDEAETRAQSMLLERNPEWPEEELETLAQNIGIGSVKYADLSKNRTSDYVFDWEQMLSLQGDTAPYLLYPYARIQRIFENGEINPAELPDQAVSVDEEERRLAVHIAAFNDTLNQVAEEGMPHYLCGYLHELATRFSQFYEACPILKEAGEVRERRLVLAHQTAQTLASGLDLLGIGVVQRM